MWLAIPLQGQFSIPKVTQKCHGEHPGGGRGAAGGPGAVGGRLEPLLGSKVVFRLDERPLWDTSPDPADPADPPDPGEVVAASVPQTLPSTRAGGQDDVS